MRPDGIVHEYCPPEQVVSEMERLVEMHNQHLEIVAPEVEAAWLHHRFTQTHPFQDGNGRVARTLASLIFIRQGLFPIVITRSDRQEYINASEAKKLMSCDCFDFTLQHSTRHGCTSCWSTFLC